VFIEEGPEEILDMLDKDECDVIDGYYYELRSRRRPKCDLDDVIKPGHLSRGLVLI
jgi:hypothetical protein